MKKRNLVIDVLGYRTEGLYSIAAKPLVSAVFIEDENGTYVNQDAISIPLAKVHTTRLYKCIDLIDAKTGVFVGRALSSIVNPWLYPGINALHFDVGCLILLEIEKAVMP